MTQVSKLKTAGAGPRHLSDTDEPMRSGVAHQDAIAEERTGFTQKLYKIEQFHACATSNMLPPLQ